MNTSFWGQTKPPMGVPLNFGSPLVDGLLEAWTFQEGFGSPRELKRGRFGTITGTTCKWGVGKTGNAIQNAGVVSNYVLAGTYKLGLSDPLKWGFSFQAMSTNVAVLNRIYFPGTGVTDDPEVVLGLWSSTNGHIITDSTSTVSALGLTAANVIANNEWFWCTCLKRGSGATNEIWKNGNKLTLTTNETIATVDTSLARNIAGSTNLATSSLNGALSVLLIHNVPPSPEDIRTLHAGGIGVLFAPPVFRRYFIPSVVLPLGWQPQFPDLIADPQRASVAYQ